MKKTNTIIILLTILVLGLTGYIVYDKVLSTEEENNNYQDNNNNNNNNKDNNSLNNDIEQDEIDNIYEMKTIKTYGGCGKYIYDETNSQYDVYRLVVKENNKCILEYGTGSSNQINWAINYYDCETQGSYILASDFIPLYFKINTDDTITYQNANIVMKKVDSSEVVNYDFCKKNY